MRIDYLIVKNFKGFDSQEFNFHPQFNLIIGKNGTGKTSLLDALSVAMRSWFLGLRGTDSRHIKPHEVRLAHFPDQESGFNWENIYPCTVTAHGDIRERALSWTRSLNTPHGRTTYIHATEIKRLAEQTDQAIRSGHDIILPLISYYGTGRLWQEPRETFLVSDPTQVIDKAEQSRLAGYKNSTDPRLSVNQLTRWITRQSWISFQQKNRISPLFRTIKKALISCLEEASNLSFDATLGEVVVEFPEGTQPFSNLSDGQRGMLAMVGDIAQKAAKLNPHLGHEVLQKTPGVVLIDELDLHLHPRWQRRVIDDLRRVFPKIQFISTTHSPFLIQSLRPGELINLDPANPTEYSNKSIEDITEEVMNVAMPQKKQTFHCHDECG